MGLIASIAINTARRIGEIGFIVGAVGGLLIALGFARGSRAGATRGIMVLAGLCVAVGFVLGIVAFHWSK